MIIFENSGEIDPQTVSLIGVNVKETDSAIGYFGTGLKYAVACLARWGETMTIQSGLAEFTFAVEETTVRGKPFQIIDMCSRLDRLRLGFTTELGKQWEPWMIYRELWCNAHDETGASIYEANRAPLAVTGLTRVIVDGPKIAEAHSSRRQFILEGRTPLHVIDGLEIYEGQGERIFYRGIAVQKLSKPSIYTYNITERLYLTEDRTAGSWSTDLIIARGLTQIEDKKVIDATLTAPGEKMEARLDYDFARNPGDVWAERAHQAASTRPLDVPRSVRSKFERKTPAKVCPTCGRPVEAHAEEESAF